MMRFPILKFGRKKDDRPVSGQDREWAEDYRESGPSVEEEETQEDEAGDMESPSYAARSAGPEPPVQEGADSMRSAETSGETAAGSFPSLPVYGSSARMSNPPAENGNVRMPYVPPKANAADIRRPQADVTASMNIVPQQMMEPPSGSAATGPGREEDLSDTLILEESVTVRLDLRDPALQPGAAAPQRTPGPEVRIGCFSHKGTRDYQQDALAFKTDEWLRTNRDRAAGVLCDGMGGLNAGEKASGYASGRLLEELDVSWDEFPEIYPDALSDINYEVAHLKDSSGAFLKTGTTVVSAVIENGGLFYASVGDSRIYLLRDGRLVGLTRDHTYGNQLDDMAASGRISQQEARSSANRAALTSYLGSRRLEQIHYNREEMQLVSGDIVLLCSDGLYKSLSVDEIAYVMRSCGPDVALMARHLVETAVARPGRHDNTTVLLMGYIAN